MGLPASQVREARRQLGLSQAELGQAAGVSLATVQNVEAGRANPSLSTLERILAPLGLSLSVEAAAADWDALVALGVPLSGAASPAFRPTPELLRRHVHLAALEVARGGSDAERERRREALQAVLVALEHHHPSTFARLFAGSEAVQALRPAALTGHLIKLRRIALRALAEYL